MARKGSGGWAETIKTVVYAILIAVVVGTVAFEPFNIPSASMVPTLLVGDYLFVSKYSYGYSRYSLPLGLPLIPGRILTTMPERGDVAVFKLPKDNKTDYIKRIVGLPGETIEVKGTQVFINGSAIPQPFAHFLLPHDPNAPVNEGDPREHFGPATVPAGHYFAMGDNRDNSQDSRYWGFLPAHYVKGRALMIYWSFDEDEGGPRPSTSFLGTRWSRLLHQIH